MAAEGKACHNHCGGSTACQSHCTRLTGPDATKERAFAWSAQKNHRRGKTPCPAVPRDGQGVRVSDGMPREQKESRR